jgi:hypothetical protein
VSTYFNSAKIMVAAIGLAFAASAIAQDTGARTSRKEYHQAMASAKADYKSAVRACPSARGADRDSCRKQARDTRDAAYGDARAKHGMSAMRGGSTSSNPAYSQQNNARN